MKLQTHKAATQKNALRALLLEGGCQQLCELHMRKVLSCVIYCTATKMPPLVAGMIRITFRRPPTASTAPKRT
jgi:hypothetical protein